MPLFHKSGAFLYFKNLGNCIDFHANLGLLFGHDILDHKNNIAKFHSLISGDIFCKTLVYLLMGYFWLRCRGNTSF